jgi:hypothetical protein
MQNIGAKVQGKHSAAGSELTQELYGFIKPNPCGENGFFVLPTIRRFADSPIRDHHMMSNNLFRGRKVGTKPSIRTSDRLTQPRKLRRSKKLIPGQ